MTSSRRAIMLRTALPVVVVLLLPSQRAVEVIYPGYTWQALGGGIYVHMWDDPLAGPIDGTSTVIVNDEDVFVVDTHINPAAARAVIAKIRAITDNPVTHVINTHWHDDHTNGNHAYRQAFPEARFIAHRATRSSLDEGWASMEDQRRRAYEAVRGRDLATAADAIEANDPDRAMTLRLFAAYRDALEPELPTLELVYPDLLFDDRMVFERGERTIVVQWMGRGNTDGDAVVWLPDDRRLIAGDLLVAPIPYAFDSPMVDWVGTLARVADLGAEIIVPGHGAVQRDMRYLAQVASLLDATIATVRDAHAAGVGYDHLAAAVDLTAQERRFTGGDAARAYAWRSFYLEPGLKSAWTSLGYPVPQTQ